MIKVLRGMFGIIINVVIYVAVILVIYKAGVFAYDFSYQVFGDPVMSEYSTDPIIITVEQGDGVKAVAKDLKEQGLIKYENAFILHTKLSKYNGMIMPGTYELSKAMSVEEILSAIATPSAGESETSTGESGDTEYLGPDKGEGVPSRDN